MILRNRDRQLKSHNHLTVVDLFAGCGGLSLGLELVGFKPILAVELSDSARLTYSANRKYLNKSCIQRDVRHLAGKTPGELRRLLGLSNGEYPTLLSGGPPCQGYSGIGHRRTHTDVEKREIVSNHLYKDMVSLITKIEPSVFLFENVRGLLSARWNRHEPGKVWDSVRKHFAAQLGKNYIIAFEVVRGFEYGVPQNRPRVLMIGYHRRHWSALGWTEDWVTSILAQTKRGNAVAITAGLLPPAYEWKGFVPNIQELLSDLVDTEWKHRSDPRGKRVCPVYPAVATGRWQIAMRAKSHRNVKALKAGAKLQDHEFSKHSKTVMDRFAAAQETDDLKPPRKLRTRKFSQRALPPKWLEEPHITIASLPDDYVHYVSHRSLTVREWARLQGFPDWYEFLGPRTTGGHRRAGDVRNADSARETPKYTQIGNAVPVPLAAAIGWHLRALLAVPNSTSRGTLWNTPLSILLREHFANPLKNTQGGGAI